MTSIPAKGFGNATVVWGQIGLVGLPSKGSNWPLINDWFWSICISNAFKGSRAAGGDSWTLANPGGGINACWGWTCGVGSVTKFRSRSSTLMAELGSAGKGWGLLENCCWKFSLFVFCLMRCWPCNCDRFGGNPGAAGRRRPPDCKRAMRSGAGGPGRNKKERRWKQKKSLFDGKKAL